MTSLIRKELPLKRLFALSVICFALAAPTQAAPITVDFEELGALSFGGTLSNDGYDFTILAGNLVSLLDGQACGPACAGNGTVALVVSGDGLNPFATQPLTMTASDDSTFYLQGLDFAEFVVGGDPTNADFITLTGYLFGGGTVTQTLSVDSVNDGPGGGVDFQSAVLNNFWATSLLVALDFAGISNVSGDNQAFQIDNVRVDDIEAVPEPGSLLLLGSGAVLVGAAIRRRQRRG